MKLLISLGYNVAHTDDGLSKEIEEMIARIAAYKHTAVEAIRKLWDRAVQMAIKVKHGTHEPGQHAFTVQIFRNLASISSETSLSAVPLSMARPYMKLFNRQRYSQIFNKYGSGKGQDKFRIYIPLSTGKPSVKAVVAPQEIVDYLGQQKMLVHDYKLGTALLPDGKRVVRLGKVLKDARVKKIYEQDPQRAATKSVPAWVVISRHPYDVIGMSFDRGWTSCMNLEDGEYRNSLKAEIKNGTLVAYLLKETDKNINAPVARIALKVYQSGEHRILVPSQRYGTATPQFSTIAAKFCDWANSGSPEGNYRRAPGSYDDGIGDFMFHLKDYSSKNIQSLSPKAQESISINPASPPEVLAELAKSSDINLRVNVAANPGTSLETLETLSQDESPNVRNAVAYNTSTPLDLLLRLSKSKDRLTRAYVAENSNSSLEILSLLAKDSNYSVRIRVAANSKTPLAALELLAKDAQTVVRLAVCRNRNTNLGIQTLLAKDSDKYIREKLADNPKTFTKALAILALDTAVDIREAVAKNKNTDVETLAILARDKTHRVRLHAGENPATPAESLLALSNSKDWSILSAVSCNPSLPPGRLAELSTHENAMIRLSIAGNKSTPIETLRAMIHDKGYYYGSIRSEAKKNLKQRSQPL